MLGAKQTGMHQEKLLRTAESKAKYSESDGKKTG